MTGGERAAILRRLAAIDLNDLPAGWFTRLERLVTNAERHPDIKAGMRLIVGDGSIIPSTNVGHLTFEEEL